jgi:ribonuclease PH
LPFASGEHKKRSRGDKQIGELTTMLRETVDSLLFTAVYPKSQIDIVVEVCRPLDTDQRPLDTD